MNADPLSVWLGFLASPLAPKTAMSPMELDGYLTGIIVSPDTLAPSEWLDAIWGGDAPAFYNDEQLQPVIEAIRERYDAIASDLDAERIDASEPVTYRPLFLASGDKPKHDIVRIWVRGFGKAMALAPKGWSKIAKSEHLQSLLTPFIAFAEDRDPIFEAVENFDEFLDEAAANIPYVTIVLRKAMQFAGEHQPARRSKIGRNEPCPCGSGAKYKRCCGAD